MQDIILSKGTYALLKANGQSDAQHGIDRFVGWKEICEAMGYSRWERTPAQEAYEDGWYSYRKPEVNNG